MEAHEGTLTVRSELKKGSTFIVLIPLKARVKETMTKVIGGSDNMAKDDVEVQEVSSELISSGSFAVSQKVG